MREPAQALRSRPPGAFENTGIHRLYDTRAPLGTRGLGWLSVAQTRTRQPRVNAGSARAARGARDRRRLRSGPCPRRPAEPSAARPAVVATSRSLGRSPHGRNASRTQARSSRPPRSRACGEGSVARGIGLPDAYAPGRAKPFAIGGARARRRPTRPAPNARPTPRPCWWWRLRRFDRPWAS